jgi:hypothetical protein
MRPGHTHPFIHNLAIRRPPSLGDEPDCFQNGLGKLFAVSIFVVPIPRFQRFRCADFKECRENIALDGNARVALIGVTLEMRFQLKGIAKRREGLMDTEVLQRGKDLRAVVGILSDVQS